MAHVGTQLDTRPDTRPGPRSGARPRRVSLDGVRARLGEPDAVLKGKILDRIDDYSRLFIAHSPFLSLATADAAGRADCSPRGDYPGL